MGNKDVVEVQRIDLAGFPLRGFSLDGPTTGELPGDAAVTFQGWIVAQAPAIAIEFCHEGVVLLRTAVNQPRPDVAAVHPDWPGAATSGFCGQLPLTNLRHFQLDVRAVLNDQRRIPVAALLFDRRSRDIVSGMRLVSVVIPCYRQAHFLGDAIESVLAQTYPHVEIVVVDDGSPDNTAEVVSRYPGVRIHRQRNAGLAAARNAGLRDSRGEYLVFLDADDRLLPEAIAAGLESLRSRPDAAFTFGRFQCITLDRVSYPAPPTPRFHDCYVSLLRHNYIAMHSTVMFRRTAVQAVNGFNPAMRACEDYDLYLRIGRTHSFCRHDQLVAEYRQHGDNMTKNSGLMLRYAVTALALQRDHALASQAAAGSYRRGLQFLRKFYGQPLVSDIISQVRTGDLRAAARGLLTLLRYDPVRFCGFVAGRFREGAERIPESRGVDERDRQATQAIVACPECHGTLAARAAEFVCRKCGVGFPQLSRTWFDFFPPSFLEKDATRWEDRQKEMEEWYRSVVADPQATADMFDRDYGPYHPYLQSLSGTVLDLGGGAGVTRHYLSSGVRYIVLDPSSSWLERSWQRLGPYFPCLEEPLTFVRGVGEFLPFADQSFDAVVSFWSLNHASDPNRVFREVHRVLRPGGRFLAVLEDIPDPAGANTPAESGDDHIPIDEADLDGWIAGRFTIDRRVWVQGTAPTKYLTFELIRHAGSVSPTALQEVA